MNSLRLLLLPFSLLYGIVAGARNWFFDIGILGTAKLDVPVISIGNISVGGTGKTPFVEFIAQKLKVRGHFPAIVSRGYGRKTRGYILVSDGRGRISSVERGGDEPILLADKLSETPIAVDENRVEGARRILKETTADCIVLDDGFQHRYLHRDLNIVLLTAREILAKQWLLPAGNRRECIASIRRADMVVISKCKDEEEYNLAADALKKVDSPRMSGFSYESTSLRKVSSGAPIDQSSLAGSHVAIAAGLGDFESFMNSVEQLGCIIEKIFEYPDHHWYSEQDLVEMQKVFQNPEMNLLITTEKDLVRIRALGKAGNNFFNEFPVAVLDVRPRFIAGEGIIDGLIEGVFT